MKNVLLWILIIFVFSCKSQQIPSSDEAVIIMEKTPCFGSCPVYEMTIFKDRQVLLDAKQYLDLKGRFLGKLSEDDYDALLDKFNNSDFYDFEDSYTANITDLPTTYLTYRSDGKEKKIKDYHGAPDALKDLEAEVNSLINKLNWKEVKEDD